MTDKELIYIEDALGHEKFMQSCAMQTASQLTDPLLASYVTQLHQKHTEIYNKFLNLL